MKKILLSVVAVAAFFVAGTVNAQTEFQYRRSSLATIMLDTHDGTLEAQAGIKKVLVETYNAKPTPDKYNDHNLKVRSLDARKLPAVTKEEIAVYEKSGAMAAVTKAAKSATAIKTDAEYIAQLMKWMEQNHVAGQMVSKWFDISSTPKADGQFWSLSLIAERGLKGYSAEEIQAAKEAKGGENKLINGAIFDLIPNTFLAVTRYSFTSAEEIIELTAGPVVMANAQSSNPLVAKGAILVLEGLKKTIQGYFVNTKTYLFQMDWSAEKFEEFGTVLASNDGKKINSFVNSSAFTMKYVGQTSKFAPACMTVSLNNQSKELIKRATLRSTDAVIAKLQQEYDVFKTLAPIYIEGSDITALIGMNEGLEGGEKFEVLELSIDAKTGQTVAKPVQKITAIKGKVWDNRAGAAEEAAEKKEGEDAASLGKTYFKGKAKKLMPGMFIRQIK